jgi:hypothetical protein
MVDQDLLNLFQDGNIYICVVVWSNGYDFSFTVL